ncbi:MAG: DHH family phosphoesterase [Planctomycetota bacterium]
MTSATTTDWTTNTTASELADWLRDKQRVLLLTHQKPDGDAAGSMTALARALAQAGAERVVGVVAGPTPNWFEQLTDGVRVLLMERGAVETLEGEGFQPDAIVIQDTGSRSQLEPMLGLLEGRGSISAIVDHHLAGDGALADRRLIDPSRAAVCQLTASLACALLGQSEPRGLPADIASPLYLGLATDTGWFKHSNVSPEVHRVAAELLEAGADSTALFAMVEQSERPSRLRLLARALASLELHADGRIAIMTLTESDFRAARAGPGETGGMIDLGLTMRGVSVSVLATEVAESDPPRTKLSFRSSSAPLAGEPVDVNAVASSLGGGGHARAAGARVDAPVDEAKRRVLGALGATE